MDLLFPRFSFDNFWRLKDYFNGLDVSPFWAGFYDDGLKRCRRMALCIIWARNNEKNCAFNKISKDVVLLIAKVVWNTRNEEVWTPFDETPLKIVQQFSHDNAVLMWALLPGAARKMLTDRLKDRIGDEAPQHGWMFDYDEAKPWFFKTFIAILNIELNPPKVIRQVWTPNNYKAFENYQKKLKNKNVGDMWISRENYGFWAWALRTYYSTQCGWRFWIKLDMNRTEQFAKIAWRFPGGGGVTYSDGIFLFEFKTSEENIFKSAKIKAVWRYQTERCILSYLDMKTIKRVMAVCKRWRFGIWIHFFENPVTRYLKTKSGEIMPVWE